MNADREDAAPTANQPYRRRDVVDVRLALPAMCAMALVWIEGELGTPQRAAIAIIFASGVVMALVAGTRAPRHTEQLRLVAVLCALLGTIAILGTVQSLHYKNHVLSSTDALRTTAVVDVTALARPTRNGAVMVPVHIVEVHRGAKRWTMRSPALLFSTDPAWSSIEPGSRVRTVISLSPDPAAHSSWEPAADEFLARPLGTPELVHGPRGAQWPAQRIRSQLAGNAAELPAPANALLPSMVLGDQRTVEPELSSSVKAAGLAHLAAVSGANIAYVVAGAVWAAARLGAGRRTRFVVAGIAVAGFVVTVGPEPSVIRAAATAAIGTYAVLTARTRQSLSILATIVIAASALAPTMVRSLGFALSCAATAGIVLAARSVEKRLSFTGKLLAPALAVALVAHFSTLPILATSGKPVSPWAIVANVAVAPAVPIVTIVGTAGAAIGALVPEAGRIAGWICVPALWWIGTVAQTVAGWATQ